MTTIYSYSWHCGPTKILKIYDFIGNLITMLWLKRDFFSRAIPSISADIIFPSVFTSQSALNSRVFEVSKIILTFCMMSETHQEAFENVSFFG